jgi:hypothetical protein
MNIVLDEAIENVSTSEKNNIGMVVCLYTLPIIRDHSRNHHTYPIKKIGIKSLFLEIYFVHFPSNVTNLNVAKLMFSGKTQL